METLLEQIIDHRSRAILTRGTIVGECSRNSRIFQFNVGSANTTFPKHRAGLRHVVKLKHHDILHIPRMFRFGDDFLWLQLLVIRHT